MGQVTMAVERIPGTEDLPLPTYATSGSAGLDLYAALEQEELKLPPGHRALIPTGIKLAIPPGYEGQVRARSGSAWKRGLGMVNSPGTIDSDFRGEVQIILINWSDEEQVIRRGDRIAQLIIAPVARVDLVEEAQLDLTERGGGGLGHTGI
jgi:dUTP pyrophosphatase